MKRFMTKLLLMSMFVLATLELHAQAPVAAREQGITGFTETETLQGELQSSGNVVKLDSTVGYDLNKRFGVFVGIPFYFASVPSQAATPVTTNNSSSAGIGNIYLGFAYRASNPALHYVSTLILAAPTGSVSAGRSSGRANFDWSNYFDHSFTRLTPFVDAGLSNSVPDTRLVTEPFTSLGLISHFEEGASYDLVRHFSLGASAYQIVPFGDQKVFSKLVHDGGGSNRGPGGGSNSGPGSRNSGHDGFRQQFLTSGTGLTRENGGSAWLGFEPSAYWSAQAGISRSITYAYTSFVFNVGVNVGRLLQRGPTK